MSYTYLREILFDCGYLGTDFITRMDIIFCLDQLALRGDITKDDIFCLDMHISGYGIAEVEIVYPDASARLASVLTALASTMRYIDDDVLVQAYDRRRNPAPIEMYKRKLFEYSQLFY